MLPDHSVLCSHGDLIPAVIELLVRQGTEQDGPSNWRKGSVWVLERDGDRMATARAMPPQRYSASSNHGSSREVTSIDGCA